MSTNPTDQESASWRFVRLAHEWRERALRAEAERDRLREALAAIDRAITDVGPVPAYHEAKIREVRRGWPTLWTAIENARALVESE